EAFVARIPEEGRAPIDPAALGPVLAPPGQARSLPGIAYTSPDVFAWEMDHFFERSWPCIGRVDGPTVPGGQAAVRAGGAGIILVRGSDGVLRAFHNACRHRGHELLECGSTTNERVIKCPY